MKSPYDNTAKDMRQQKHCGEGWTRELVNPFLDIVCLVSTNVPITQIKEKFGTLRIYHAGPEWVETLSNIFEIASEHCCEECGVFQGHYDEANKGYAKVYTGPLDSGWVKTLCVPCRDKRNAERKKADEEYEQRRLAKLAETENRGDVV